MKAVLVIDIPCIDKSQINYLNVSFGGLPYCIGRDEMILRPLPKPITEYQVKVSYDYDADYAQGWNDCLNEITGDTE